MKCKYKIRLVTECVNDNNLVGGESVSEGKGRGN